MTALENMMDQYERYRQAQAKLNEANKSLLFDALSAANISRVRVDFDGEGDSGQINDVAVFCGEEPAKLPAAVITISTASWGSTEIETVQQSLPEAIETLCYGYLEQEHGGWENNDGAYGEFDINVIDRVIELEFFGRFTDCEKFSHSF